jgi:hypothetical protein
MSHDTNHGHSAENKTIISFKNSFWLVIIIVGLFIAALNFIQAESGSKEEGKEVTEMKAGGEATGEKSEQKAAEAPKPEAEKDAAKSAK